MAGFLAELGLLVRDFGFFSDEFLTVSDMVYLSLTITNYTIIQKLPGKNKRLNFAEFKHEFTIELHMEKQPISLLEMVNGETATVLAISSQKHTIQKLHQLGIRAGVEIQLLRRAPLDGPLLVKVCGREIAIGFGLCKKIQVGVKN